MVAAARFRWADEAPAAARPALLALFHEAGANAQATTGLLRELLAVFPDPSDLGPRIRDREHEGTRSTGSAPEPRSQAR